jgi:hypothetical protein
MTKNSHIIINIMDLNIENVSKSKQYTPNYTNYIKHTGIVTDMIPVNNVVIDDEDQEYNKYVSELMWAVKIEEIDDNFFIADSSIARWYKKAKIIYDLTNKHTILISELNDNFKPPYNDLHKMNYSPIRVGSKVEGIINRQGIFHITKVLTKYDNLRPTKTIECANEQLREVVQSERKAETDTPGSIPIP